VRNVEPSGRPEVPQGFINLRDLGGLPARDGRRLRSGLVYRAASLHHAEADGWPDDIPLPAIVIDLRTPDEIERTGACPPIGTARRHTLPLLTGLWGPNDYDPDEGLAGIFAERYLRMAADAAPSIAAALELLAGDDGLPAVFFCTAGKDRAGVLTAILLAADYARSAEPVIELSEWTRSPLLSAPEEAMRRFLTGLCEAYGDAAAYAASIGVARGVIEELKTRLVV
jgi:protein-tyrosine phosphatase